MVAFAVSGEHVLLNAHPAVQLEYLSGLERAGAELVVSYAAKRLAAALTGREG